MIRTALVRHVLFPLHEQLKRKPTFRWLRELERTQWYSATQVQELQAARLRSLLAFAHRHVPYYRQLLDERGLSAHRFGSVDDVRRLPFLSRDVIRDRFDDLTARARLRGVHRRSSGGSTGSPVTVLVDMERMGFGEASRLRAQRWFGVEPGAREICVWGAPIELTKQDRVRELRDWLLGTRIVSAFDMDGDRMAAYLATIARVQPEKLYCYASAAARLAHHALATSWTPPARLKAVFTTAETLFDDQRRAIAAAFGAAVGVEYGARDAGLIALACPRGTLHIAAEGMLVEVVDRDEDGRGEIVVTNLVCAAMPIIRYRTGDLGILETDPCPCGRGLPALRRLEGRQNDFLVSRSGRVLHGQSIVHALRAVPGIAEFQIEQDPSHRVVIRIVPAGGFGDVQHREITERGRRLLGDDTDIAIERVARIVRSPSGKLRHVVSHVPTPAAGAPATAPAR